VTAALFKGAYYPLLIKTVCAVKQLCQRKFGYRTDAVTTMARETPLNSTCRHEMTSLAQLASNFTDGKNETDHDDHD